MARLTAQLFGETNKDFVPGASGLRSWWSQYQSQYPNASLVETGDGEPYLRVKGSLIDVISGGKWSWRKIDQGSAEADVIEGESRAEEEREQRNREAADLARETAEDVDQGDLYEGEFTPPTGGEAAGQTQESLQSAAFNPPNSRWDENSQTWITLNPGQAGYDPTWGGLQGDSEEESGGLQGDSEEESGGYYQTGNPCSWTGDAATNQARFDSLKSTYDSNGWVWPFVSSLANCGTETTCEDDEHLVDGHCVKKPECSPTQKYSSKEKKCVDKPPCGKDRRGILRVRDATTGRCVRDPDTTKNGTGNGTSTPGTSQGYGTDPDYPWDVDLSYLKDAPPFEFDYDPWVEPDPFTYAAYDQPDAFSYPEFAPPTGQQLLEEDPGYQFRLDEGSKALQRSAAARGTLRSGATLKGLIDYGQNTASEEYQRAYNRRLKQYQEGSRLSERAYDMNLGAGQWAHETNLGAAQDQWAANRKSALEGYGTNLGTAYQVARDKYAPGLATWNAEQSARDRAAFAKYGRQWQAYTYNNPSETTWLQIGTGMAASPLWNRQFQ
jgi:hypothetical protein